MWRVNRRCILLRKGIFRKGAIFGMTQNIKGPPENGTFGLKRRVLDKNGIKSGNYEIRKKK